VNRGFALSNTFAADGDQLGRLEQRLGDVLGQIRSACEERNVRDLVASDVHFHEAIMTSYGDPDLEALWRRVIMRMMMRYDRFSDLMDSFAEEVNDDSN